MSQRNIDKASRLLLKSSPADTTSHVELCLTCRELWASAQSHCNWCASLWWQITCRSPFREMNESSLRQLYIKYDLTVTPKEERNSGAVSVAGRLECYVWPSQARSVRPYHFTLQIVNISDGKASRYKIPEKTSSAASRILASQWISNCTQNHKKCRIDKISWLPTRLVNVGLDGGATRLVETIILSKNQYSPYLALSHRWGATPNHSSRLSSVNKLAWMKSIPTNQMPATFQDAIQYTKSMNISYIWIDSLCIMQDSPEDWSTEAALMDKVYAQSFCNIAASYASNENSLNTGLFYTRTPDDLATTSVKYKLITKNDCQGIFGISLKSNYIIDDTEFALYGRAWVLQERLLSPRTIHFSKQLIWECREERASESFPMGISLMSDDRRDHDFSKDWRSSLEVFGYKFWADTVGRYVKSSLTYSSDYLVAISAIAREYERELDDVYLAGLWKKGLPFNLLWKTDNKSSFSSRPNAYRCPTWSWASLNICYPAKLEILIPDGEALAEVLEAKVFSPPGRTYTECYDGHIRLKGILYSVGYKDVHEWLRGDGHKLFFGKEIEPCRRVSAFLDIKIQKSDRSRLYLIPIVLESRPRFIWCLILRSILMGSMEFERVGVLIFSLEDLGKYDEQLRPIMEWAEAKDPLSRDLKTIIIY
ncbi:putative heterokaryon incompatibility protein [Botrytis fragariae]|uniref:Putative heterokaryon incompatibility protein n=1 Tax=Botrytis fragariae TaxID=1964551 RepID=A0A8H6EDC1_9HELO|nr:putative heterokaryon incompatibility protein [Botrytis fragariae]KAF5868157.1 putative heterokaryon incompatibility protein [Botrytis fragariae]